MFSLCLLNALCSISLQNLFIGPSFKLYLFFKDGKAIWSLVFPQKNRAKSFSLGLFISCLRAIREFLMLQVQDWLQMCWRNVSEEWSHSGWKGPYQAKSNSSCFLFCRCRNKVGDTQLSSKFRNSEIYLDQYYQLYSQHNLPLSIRSPLFQSTAPRVPFNFILEVTSMLSQLTTVSVITAFLFLLLFFSSQLQCRYNVGNFCWSRWLNRAVNRLAWSVSQFTPPSQRRLMFSRISMV